MLPNLIKIDPDMVEVIQRYDILGWSTRFACLTSNDIVEEPASDGEWVKWEDIEDDLRELEELRKKKEKKQGVPHNAL